MTAQAIPTKEELLALLRSSGDEVATVLRALPPEAFTRVCYEGGWTGREVVAHLASIEWTYPRLIDQAKPAVANPASADGDKRNTSATAASGDIDAYNARQVAKRAAVSLDDLLDEFARNRATTIAAVEATDETLLAAPVRTAAGLTGPLGTVMEFVAVRHVRGHLRDLTSKA